MSMEQIIWKELKIRVRARTDLLNAMMLGSGSATAALQAKNLMWVLQEMVELEQELASETTRPEIRGIHSARTAHLR